jgi:hypothetical protein
MTSSLVAALPRPPRIRLDVMRILNNRLRAGPIVLLLIVLPMLSAASQGVPSHWYRRATSLPTMKMTRAELTQLVDEILPIAKRLEPVDTVIPNPYSHPAEGFMATSIDGRTMSSRDFERTSRDSLERWLGATTGLTFFSMEYQERRWFRNRALYANQPRVQSLGLTLSATTQNASRYEVQGFDRARIDSIADRIEAFGRAHETRWTPRVGKYIEAGMKALALILLPLALQLRDRRFVWTLYLLSAGMFVAAFTFPFAAYFPSVVIAG